MSTPWIRAVRLTVPLLLGLACPAQGTPGEPRPAADAQTSDPAQRVRALIRLAEQGPAAAARASEAALGIGDPETEVRQAAVTALLALRPDLAPAEERLRRIAGDGPTEYSLSEEWETAVEQPDLEALIRDLQAREPEVRAQAVQKLGAVGNPAEPALPRLLDLVGDPAPAVRAALAPALSSIAWNEAISEALRSLLKDEDQTVRMAAARGLARDDADAVAVLRGAMQDPAVHVREAAVRALGRCGRAGRRAEADLVATLRDLQLDVRLAALDAIGRLRLSSARAIDEILRHTDDPDGRECMGALLCLQRIGDRAARAFPRVREISRMNGQPRCQRALDTLWSIAGDDLRGAAALRLVEVLCSDDETLSEHAEYTLQDWAHPWHER